MSFLTLDEYLTGARKIMTAQKFGFLTNDEDAVAHVAYRMMLADQTWDGSSSRETWRYNQARYAILRVMFKKKKEHKRNVKSLDYGWDMVERQEGHRARTLADRIEDRSSHEDVYRQFLEVCKCADTILTGRPQECFDLYYRDRLNMEEIGKKLGITKQAVSLHVKRGIKEIKKWMSKQD